LLGWPLGLEDDGLGTGIDGDGDGGGADEVGGGGGALVVGAGDGFFEGDGVGLLVVGAWLGVGADEVGAGGTYGAWPVCGAVPSISAGGGNCSTGTPSMSRRITSVQVCAG
jgi:hypothetical protein